MYQGSNDGGRDEYSSEAFLLGKRRIDSILRGDDAKKVEKTAGPTGEAPGPLSIVASARDTAAKIREDPLVAIKRQEQEAYQAMMKDPSKRRQLLAQMGIAEEKPKSKHREGSHRSHKHRSRRHRDDNDSDHEGRRRKRRDDTRDRSRSPRRVDDDSDYERRRKRRRSDSRDEPRTAKRYDSESDSARRHKDRRSNSQDEGRDRRRYDSEDEDREKERNKGPSDRRRRDNSDGTRRDNRDYGTRRRNDDYERRDGRERRDYTDRRRYNGHNEKSQNNGSRTTNQDDEERERKLAAMQADAMDLDRAREARLAALAEKEQAERDADDRVRAKSSKYGGREFANRLHNSAGNESLADRIGRGRQGLQRDDD